MVKDRLINRYFHLAIALFLCLIAFASPLNALAASLCPSGMALIEGGSFTIGADDSGYEEERSATDVCSWVGTTNDENMGA